MSHVIDFLITLDNSSTIGDTCCSKVEIEMQAGEIVGINVTPADARVPYQMRLPNQEDIVTITSRLVPMR